MATLVALLRGINLGSRNRIRMAELRDLLERAGFENVRTLLQSGNVVLDTRRQPPAAARSIERAIEERLGVEIGVVVRTANELADVVAADPMGAEVTDPSRYFVVFLDGPPPSGLPGPAPGERLESRERELYVWCPDGMRNSRLMAALAAKRTAPGATTRNWRTVTKLLELARG